MTGPDHSYRVRVRWEGDLGTGTSGYREYSRASTAIVEGKPALALSSDAPFRGDRARWNPEDLLLAALAECHLLSFLHAAVGLGIVVTAYEDEAEAVLVLDGNAGAFREAVLRPRVEVAEESMLGLLAQAHESASRWCFIANSVNFPVRHEPTGIVRPPAR